MSERTEIVIVSDDGKRISIVDGEIKSFSSIPGISVFVVKQENGKAVVTDSIKSPSMALKTKEY